jgi:sugar/nucleoside kinase (ribokinase family)
MTADVIAIGLTTLDIVGHPIDALPAGEAGILIGGIEVVPAGTAGGFAMVAATLGLRAKLVSALGDDRPGRMVRMMLEDAGVDTSLVPIIDGVRSSATILPIDSAGRRPTLHAPGAAMLMEITDSAIEAAARARFVHWAAIGGFRIDPGARSRLLQAARQNNAYITCDLIAPGPTAREELEAILPYVDCFMPSLAEARLLTGQTLPQDAASALLSMGARQCIIKLGRDGALIATAEAQQTVPAFDIPVTDTSSCGDAFCAGYVAGLAQGWTVLQSAVFASATAALVAQGLGTLGALQNFAHTEDAAQTMKIRSQS